MVSKGVFNIKGGGIICHLDYPNTWMIYIHPYLLVMRLYMCTDPYGQTPSGCEFGIIWSVKYLKFIINMFKIANLDV